MGLYACEIRQVRSVRDTDVPYVFQHEELDWLMLFTCEGYNPRTGDHAGRRVVRAVLVNVEAGE